MPSRETVFCVVCAAAVGEPCSFPAGQPMVTDEDGTERRAVHADRYAKTLPPEQRAAFWENAIESYLAHELASLEARDAP